jgi:hypothetical protein
MFFKNIFNKLILFINFTLQIFQETPLDLLESGSVT